MEKRPEAAGRCDLNHPWLALVNRLECVTSKRIRVCDVYRKLPREPNALVVGSGSGIAYPGALYPNANFICRTQKYEGTSEKDAGFFLNLEKCEQDRQGRSHTNGGIPRRTFPVKTSDISS